jgi:chemotaxis protein CheC
LEFRRNQEMNEDLQLDQDVLEKLRTITDKSVLNAAHGFSGMVGRKINVSKVAAEVVPVLTIPEIAGRPDEDAVGIYLRFKGDVDGQMMMVVPYLKALELVDLMTEVPPGTTRHLGSLERSALGELGNLCGSFFLNSVSNLTYAQFQPTPPAVMVDMAGAILDIVVATTGGISEKALLVQANFVDGARNVDADFWVIPDMNSLTELLKKNAEE